MCFIYLDSNMKITFDNSVEKISQILPILNPIIYELYIKTISKEGDFNKYKPVLYWINSSKARNSTQLDLSKTDETIRLHDKLKYDNLPPILELKINFELDSKYYNDANRGDFLVEFEIGFSSS